MNALADEPVLGAEGCLYFLKREGPVVNHKGTERIYRADHCQKSK